MNRYGTSDEKLGRKWGFASCHLQAKIPLTLLPKNRVGDTVRNFAHNGRKVISSHHLVSSEYFSGKR